MRLRSSKTTFSDKENVDATTDTPPEQPFRFLDLPKELRLMVYEKLADKIVDVKFTSPKGLEVEQVDLDGMYCPSLLQVNKLVHDEYWPLCLRKSALWIRYTCVEPTTPDETSEQEEDFTVPALSEWVELPIKVLVRVPEVVFKFEAMFFLPPINPFSGIACCTSELLSLKSMGIWTELDMGLIDFAFDQAGLKTWLETFIDDLYFEQWYLMDLMEDEYREVDIEVDCDLYTPLYEMNKRLSWPRGRHLVQGVAPLPGLPDWGYSFFKVIPEWRQGEKDAFTYHGQELAFMRIEHELPVMERSFWSETPSEDDYEFDESGWAID
ncbi:hypothetical protein E4T49_06713 [Aureobasidium sp. EXF-10728]|nr:hypothetical protein E4T49_06713 [Aureobasidium sp. EXF-10728]